MAKAAKSEGGLAAELEEAVRQMLIASNEKKADGSHKMPLDDRLAIVDRAIKLELLRNKVKDGEAGSGWE